LSPASATARRQGRIIERRGVAEGLAGGAVLGDRLHCSLQGRQLGGVAALALGGRAAESVEGLAGGAGLDIGLGILGLLQARHQGQHGAGRVGWLRRRFIGAAVFAVRVLGIVRFFRIDRLGRLCRLGCLLRRRVVGLGRLVSGLRLRRFRLRHRRGGRRLAHFHFVRQHGAEAGAALRVVAVAGVAVALGRGRAGGVQQVLERGGLHN
jgi:hypothetical protein